MWRGDTGGVSHYWVRVIKRGGRRVTRGRFQCAFFSFFSCCLATSTPGGSAAKSAPRHRARLYVGAWDTLGAVGHQSLRGSPLRGALPAPSARPPPPPPPPRGPGEGDARLTRAPAPHAPRRGSLTTGRARCAAPEGAPRRGCERAPNAERGCGAAARAQSSARARARTGKRRATADVPLRGPPRGRATLPRRPRSRSAARSPHTAPLSPCSRAPCLA